MFQSYPYKNQFFVLILKVDYISTMCLLVKTGSFLPFQNILDQFGLIKPSYLYPGKYLRI